jgi:hypothetical protein
MYQGCPIAIFSCQFPVDEPMFNDEFKKSIERWEEMFVNFWNRPDIHLYLKTDMNPLHLSQDLINLYEGGLMNWRISKDKSYIERMETSMIERISKELK